MAKVLLTFAINVRRLAEKAQLDDQVTLAKRLGVSQSSVSDWFNGRRLPRPEHIDAICELFDCTAAELFGQPQTGKGKPVTLDDAVQMVVAQLGYSAKKLRN